MGKRGMGDSGFRNMRQVEAYLKAQGYKGSRSTISKHKRQGKIKKVNGRYSKESVDKYARTFLQVEGGIEGRIALPEDDLDMAGLQEQKLRAEIAIKRAQAKKAELQNEILLGKYIKRSDHERSIAAACGVLEAGLKHFFKLRAQDMIELVNGDLAETTALVVYLCEHLDLELTKFAKMAPVEVEIDA